MAPKLKKHEKYDKDERKSGQDDAKMYQEVSKRSPRVAKRSRREPTRAKLEAKIAKFIQNGLAGGRGGGCGKIELGKNDNSKIRHATLPA